MDYEKKLQKTIAERYSYFNDKYSSKDLWDNPSY